MGDRQGCHFAKQVQVTLATAGWNVKGVVQDRIAGGGGGPMGFATVVRNAATAPLYAIRLQQAFYSINGDCVLKEALGILKQITGCFLTPPRGEVDPLLPEGAVRIIVGRNGPWDVQVGTVQIN